MKTTLCKIVSCVNNDMPLYMLKVIVGIARLMIPFPLITRYRLRILFRLITLVEASIIPLISCTEITVDSFV